MESKVVSWEYLKNGKVTYRSLHEKISGNVKQNNDERRVINLGFGDPTPYPSFQTPPNVGEALINALNSNAFNGYPPPYGVPAARRAVAEYLNDQLPHKLSEDDVFITSGASQAIELVLNVLGRPGGNILLPRPGFPLYDAYAAMTELEVRHFDLLPDQAWEVDLDAVEALADENTIAMFLVNPGFTGNVFTFDHLQKIAEIAQRKGIIVISDEIYGHITFGNEKKFTTMGMFGCIIPVLTIGSISKRWIIPGWRLGWIAANDPRRILNESGMIECIQKYLGMTSSPTTIIQGAVSEILLSTPNNYYDKIVNTLRESAMKCYQLANEIPCIRCPIKPQGGMFFMVKLDVSVLEGIEDELDFCCKLAKEESVIFLPGIALGLKNWILVTFAIEPSYIDDAFGRIKAFYKRHNKNKLIDL